MVGVSGGLDSMALLHLLDEGGFRDVVVCHLDHGLRGAESEGDGKLVKRVAEKMGYEVVVGRVDVRGLMEVRKESLETAARGARHEFFAECGKVHRCGRLLLAHHADDQAETVLWNLMRGSHGLRGMQEVKEIRMGGRKMEVVRPLLGVKKALLREWMSGRDFKWREDASNAENDVVRNRIRNEALPLLCEISGRDVGGMLARGAVDGEAMGEVMAWAVGKAEVLDPQGRLHVKVLRDLPVALRRAAISDYLKAEGVGGISAKLLEAGAGMIDVEGVAVVNLPGGRRLRRRGGRIFIDGP